MTKYFTLLAVAFLAILFSCKKDTSLDNINHNHDHGFNNEVFIRITNVADNAIVQVVKDTVYTSLTPKYINANNDTFSVTKLMYYISNIRLKKPDNSFYTVPDTYFLINAADTLNTCNFKLSGIPADNYIGMEFIIGVDSTRNCSGAQTGALDPLHDMFWSWNQGYIFFKFEGMTSSAPNFGIHNVTYHIGGFLPPYNLIRTAYVPFSSTALNVDGVHKPTVFIKANLLEAFKNPTVIDFATLSALTSGPGAKQIANNYIDMFSLSAIQQ